MDIIIAPELWTTSLLPEGILERWRVSLGETVAPGQAVAEVRIGDNVHEILAPEGGFLEIFLPRNSIVEPGTVIGETRAALQAPETHPLLSGGTSDVKNVLTS